MVKIISEAQSEDVHFEPVPDISPLRDATRLARILIEVEEVLQAIQPQSNPTLPVIG
jgi:hypothetical protein